MVCVYCGSATQVINSRAQRRANHIWRRRKCTACAAIFTTEERAALHSSLMVASGGKLLPFSRDHLFASIHDSCRHRPASIDDATALTQTIITELLGKQAGGIITRGNIVRTAHQVLQRFDGAAATFYAAYHPIPAETAEATF